jgi:hypothetical protein
MRKGTLRWHRDIGVAALLTFGGVVLGACSPASEDAAPVYMMGTVAPDMFGKVSPVMRQSVAAAPIERTEIAAPVALAPSMTGSAAAGQSASDVIPLDEPPAPAKPAAKPALMTANPAPMSARFMPPPEPPAPIVEEARAPKTETPMVAAAPLPPAAPIAARSPTPLAAAAPAAPQPATTPMAPPRIEPSAAELARAEPTPAPLPVAAPAPTPVSAPTQPLAAPPATEPARADIATSGRVINARDDRSGRYRPRYYYAP